MVCPAVIFFLEVSELFLLLGDACLYEVRNGQRLYIRVVGFPPSCLSYPRWVREREG